MLELLIAIGIMFTTLLNGGVEPQEDDPLWHCELYGNREC